MSEFTSDVFIMDVLNSMSSSLNNEQLALLKSTLYINLHDVKLSKMTYELATTAETNDATLIDYFSISLKTANKTDKTIKQYTDAVWKLRNFTCKSLRDINHMDIKRYFAIMQSEGRWGDVTTENNHNYINAFYTFLCDEDFILKNPMRKVQRVKVHRKLKQRYSATDIESMKTVCADNTRDIALIEFLLSTALRVESVTLLKWKDLDFNSRSGYVRVKGGDIKKFRFNEKTEFYLQKYFKERMKNEKRSADEMLERPLFAVSKRDKISKDFGAIKPNGIRKSLEKIERKSGVNHVHPHKFRRTFACNAIEHGMPMEEVKEHLMHKDIQTTFIYADITDRKLEHSYRTYCE